LDSLIYGFLIVTVVITHIFQHRFEDTEYSTGYRSSFEWSLTLVVKNLHLLSTLTLFKPSLDVISINEKTILCRKLETGKATINTKEMDWERPEAGLSYF